MSTESSVVAVYAHIDQAEDAVRKLGEGGFPIQHVSIIAQNLGTEKKVHGFVTSCDVAKSAARTGARDRSCGARRPTGPTSRLGSAILPREGDQR